ncbi:carboxymuconolactone decarboxylase family protein [Streptomyces sp. AC627_RSS907]|uniref:carboxymuconolactone decarboxylase family protein n=1 Tax=Streptomyces sp. AC627_RSS907 TaxID=2823684 RepID=UPI001C2373FB|nr:carboxymuconolactone decarboxylase family protein [Streptomyces sp. AC627_RSS907]
MAASPGVLHGYLALRAAVDQYATLDTCVQEAIALAVSNENGCGCDEAAHTTAASRAGLDSEDILSIRRGDTAFDPALRALLRVVRQMVSNVGVVTDVAWKAAQAAQAAGWSEAQLAELPLHVALHTYTSTLNRWAGTEVDFPLFPTSDLTERPSALLAAPLRIPRFLASLEFEPMCRRSRSQYLGGCNATDPAARAVRHLGTTSVGVRSVALEAIRATSV